jgi:tetratricopeptide (TPR) repeat protein
VVRVLRKVLFREGDMSGAEALARDEVGRRLALPCGSDVCIERLCDAIESGLYIAQVRNRDATAEARWRQSYAEYCKPRAQERPRTLLLAGYAAMDEMRLPEAWRYLREAATAARAKHDLVGELNALGALVELEARLGHIELVSQTSQDAWTTTQTIESSKDGIGERGQPLAAYLNNIGWSLLLLREAGYRTADPTAFLTPALAIHESPGPNRDTVAASNVRINIALAAVQQGDPATAQASLRPVIERSLNDKELFWLRIVTARSEALQDRFTIAHAHADEVARLARRAADPEMQVRAAHLRGQLYEQQGRLHDALRAYLSAERYLEELAIPIGLGQGRDRYIFELQRGSRGAIEILLRLGQPDRALCALRLARGRAQRGLLADAEFRLRTGLQSRRQLDAELEACRMEVSSSRRMTCLGEVERRRRELRSSLGQDQSGEPTPVPGCEQLSPVEEGELLAAYVQLSAGWWALLSDGMRAVAVPLGKIDVGAGPELLNRIPLIQIQA